MTVPAAVKAVEAASKSLGFAMASDYETGALLRSLVASKPGGRFLELGTGVGSATAWMLDGMNEASSLLTVDNNPDFTDIAEQHLGQDSRLDIQTEDALTVLKHLQGTQFDLIFADTWPGKLDQPELALELLADGGMYVIDDMNNRHKERLEPITGIEESVLQKIPKQLNELVEMLYQRSDLHCSELNFSTGIMLCTKHMKG